jgi:AAHS family 4-hydroxybenzoate transporter-like MFS transporter
MGLRQTRSVLRPVPTAVDRGSAGNRTNKVPDQSIVDVSAAIERQQVNAFLERLVVMSWIISFFDGFDQNVISFAAPTIAQALRLTPRMMGNVFSIGLVGSMLGGFLFGAIGDRFGRRPAMILATLTFSALTVAIAFASSYSSLLVMRFAVGIGTGGMLPVCWALNIESVPKRFRSSIVTLVMLGYSAGFGLGGPVSLWLIPRYGWQSVFIFGGVLSLAAASTLIALLPESIRFLTARSRNTAAIADILHRIAPALHVPDGARFVLSDENIEAKRFTPALLFHGELRWVTPMLWLAYIFSSMAAFFLATWTPQVFEVLQFSPAEASAAGSITAVGGALGGLALMRFTDTRGAIAVAAMPTLAIPLLLIGGFVDVGHTGFLVLIGLIAFALIGGHLGMNSIAGIFYPSKWRANGAGWATSVGKLGSIAGPFLGGMILSTSLPTRNVFAVMAVCPAMELICLLVIGRIHSRMLAREKEQTVDGRASHDKHAPLR